MSQTFEEMTPFLRKQQAAISANRKTQLQARAAVGQSMAELIADPRWAVYVRHLEELRDREQNNVDVFRHALTDGKVVSQEDYAQQKVALAGAKRYVQAMDTAIKMVSDLISRGDEAAKELGNS